MLIVQRDNPAMPGFQMKFENGWTVSVMFGCMNYCNNRYSYGHDFNRSVSNECVNAEVAAWDKNGNWYWFDEHQNVKGWVAPDEVADFIQQVKNFTP